MTFGTKVGLFALTLALAPLAAQAAPAAAAAAAAGDAARGATLVKQRCGACHSLAVDTTTRPGPSLKGVSGRRSGTVANFKYSPAMVKARMTWNKANLDKYLAAPAKAVPGTYMTIAVPNATDRADIVAYLDTLKR